MVKVGINGFGRIGRVTFRAILEKYAEEVEVVAINTSGSMEIEGWANLLKYDSVYGRLDKNIKYQISKIKNEIGTLIIEEKKIPVLAQREPGKIPWEKYDVEVVLECTGVFRTTKDCLGHLKAGAKKVIISAPAKDETPTYLIGVNSDKYKGEKIISNASCTTNCIAPVAKIMMENFKVVRAMMTTIHAYTADQELVDGSHKDLRRGRAAGLNIIPTTTGAAEAMARALPELKGKFQGLAIRVPVACGSLSDFTFVLDHTVRVEKVNRVFDQAKGLEQYQGILEVTSEPIVSSDIIKNPASAIIDLSLTSVSGGNLVKVVAWYDNEWAYSCRLIELAALIAGE
ncbi:MAG: type I glyceraldehyde-3-phosphate dehydrogenase [Patescibacteria group bacterium]